MRDLRRSALAAALCVGLVGCGSNPEPEPGDRPPTAVTETDAGAEPAPPPVPQIEFFVDAERRPGAEARTGAGSRDLPPADADVARLEEALALDPDNASLQRAMGIELQRLDRKQDSIAHFERAVDLEPSVANLFDLGRAYTAVARYAEAEQAYQRVREIDPRHARTLHNMGALAELQGDDDRAGAYYQAAIASDPQYRLAYFNLAETLNRMSRPQEAYQVYLALLELDPRDPFEQSVYNDAVQRLGATALALGDPAQAEQLMSQLLDSYPEHAAAHFTRAQALLQLGRDDEARREFELHERLTAEAASDPAGTD